MRGASIIRIVVMTTAFLMTPGGTASATILTSPAGTTYTGTIKAESSKHVLIHTSKETTTCAKSTLEWKNESHGLAVTAKGVAPKFTFEECGQTTISVLKPGAVEVHAETPGSFFDVITWNDIEVTTVRHIIFGSIHCVYIRDFLWFGAITNSSALKGQTAVIDVEAQLPVKLPANPACATSFQLTAQYSVTNPDYLDVD